MPESQLNAQLICREDLTDELAIFRVQPEGIDLAEFKPGQYATLGLPQTQAEAEAYAAERSAKLGKEVPVKRRLVLRPYSIASPPKIREYLEFFLVVVPDGVLTPKLWSLREGDPLYLAPKIAGKFTLDGMPAGQDMVMISTGTGLAPYISMLHAYRVTGLWRRFIVIHGTRLSQDLAYRQELERIAAEDPSVYYIPTVTREPEDSDWQGLRGRVPNVLQPEVFAELTDGAALEPEQTHIFLCGNPAMIDQVTDEMQQRGFSVCGRENPQGNIHVESYW